MKINVNYRVALMGDVSASVDTAKRQATTSIDQQLAGVNVVSRSELTFTVELGASGFAYVFTQEIEVS